VIAATRNLLQARYSREVEANADLYALLLMDRAGLDPRALAAALQRLPGATRNDPNILATHPNIPERVATLEARARAGARGEPVMTPAEFQALRTICGGAR
jgi:predicted Zn-dependent protease